MQQPCATAVNPAKCSLKQMRIERDTPNFRPEEKQTFPVHRVGWWDWLHLPFSEHAVPPFPLCLGFFPLSQYSFSLIFCMIIYCLYIVCGHGEFEKTSFLHFVPWVHNSITLAPGKLCDVVVVVYSSLATKYWSCWPVIVGNYRYICR